MTGDPDHAVLEALTAAAAELAPGASGIEDLERLGGGASQELWGFRLAGPGTRLVLRRTPGGRADGFGLGLTLEADVMARARAAGAPTPRVLLAFPPDGPLGEAYVMEHVEGETLPGRIYRDPDFAPARARAAVDLGTALARIHASRIDGLEMRRMTPAQSVEVLAGRLAATGEARPVFELALARLARTAPDPEEGGPHLVHGDFRMGNLMWQPEGLAAALDWELAFLGDRHSDLGWLTMESWRFGQEAPVAGLCSREALIAAYEAAGGAPVSRDRMDWWEMWGALHWGIITREMAGWITSGADRSVERHVIGRRASETELLLMGMLDGARPRAEIRALAGPGREAGAAPGLQAHAAGAGSGLHDWPSPSGILAAVAEALRDGELSAFERRVNAAAVDIARREVDEAPAVAAAAQARLVALTGREGTMSELTPVLAGRIAAGEIGEETPGLMDHLWTVTLARVRVDQPGFAAYRRLVAGETDP